MIGTGRGAGRPNGTAAAGGGTRRRLPGPLAMVSLLLAALIADVAAGRPAHAQQGDPRELEAKTACLAGRSARGIELLAQLFAETNDPTYIYNQGRCFEQDGKSREAITRFREYLRKSPAIAASEKAQVQAHIRELEEQQERSPGPGNVLPPLPSGPAPPPAVSPQTVPAPALAAPAASMEAPLAPSTPSPSGESPDRARTLRIAGLVAGGVGVLGIVGAIYMHGRAADLSRQVSEEYAKGNYDKSKDDQGRRAESLQWVGYSVGAAALLTGGVLYVLGLDKGSTSETAVAVVATPVVGGGVNGSLRWTF